MKVLVTGGAGFIGSHVAETFLDAGAKVLVLDNLSTGREKNLPSGVEFEVADIREEAFAAKVIAFRPDAIAHLAAQVDVRRSVSDPGLDARINVMGTLGLLQAANQAGCRQVVFSSTGGAIYGEQREFPATEEHVCAPVSPYGTAKLCAEEYLKLFDRSGGPSCTLLRYANVYGPRQDPYGEAGVVAIFAGQMLQGQATRINGDGGQTRDFVYVSDVARANKLAVERGILGKFNIGTGIESDINSLHRTMAKLLEIPNKPEYGPPAPGEQRRSSIDPTRAGRVLGWRPKSDLETGLTRTLDYFKREIEHG